MVLAQTPHGWEGALRSRAVGEAVKLAQEIRAIMHAHAPQTEKLTMTLGEELLAEGLAKGLAKGLETVERWLRQAASVASIEALLGG